MPKFEVSTTTLADDNEAYHHIIDVQDGESILTCIQNGLEAVVLLYNKEGIESINIILTDG